jgi:eukaryotic-like serine/threonine-protein kinase
VNGVDIDALVLGDEIGRGGSGIVFSGSINGAPVAIKVLHEGLITSVSERRRFVREAEALRRIDHPGVVRLCGVGTLADGRPFLAMDRVDGDTLAKHIATHGPLAWEAAVEMLRLLAEAIDTLHAAELVHRDIKPENVLLVRGRPLLLDLGLAQSLTGSSAVTTTQGIVRGTPAYMAPERFFGEPATIASDVYEFAALLFYTIAGALPWQDETGANARLMPRRLDTLVPTVPSHVADVLQRALSTRPGIRPKSAKELLAALSMDTGVRTIAARITAGVEVQPVKADAVAKPEAPRSRKTMVLFAAGAAVTVLLARLAAERWSPEPASIAAATEVASVATAVVSSQVLERVPASTNHAPAATTKASSAKAGAATANVAPRTLPSPAAGGTRTVSTGAAHNVASDGRETTQDLYRYRE